MQQSEINQNVSTLNVWWMQGKIYIQAYLIRGKLNALIDTGPRQGEEDTLALEIASHGLEPSDIDLVLNTHGHADHIGGNAAIMAASGARIMIHREDAVFLEDHRRCFEQYYAPFYKALGREQQQAEDLAAFMQEMGPQMAVDSHLEDNELIDLGEGVDLRVIHLPGHTAGSVAYYWEREGVLFIGDSVSGLSSPGGSLPIITDLKAYAKSVNRLLDLPVNCILSSHPYRGIKLAPSIIKQGEEAKQFLLDTREFVLRLEDAIENMNAESVESLPEATDKVIAALPEEMGFKPIAEARLPQFSMTTVFWCLFNK